MSIRWVLDTYTFTLSWLGNLWQTKAQRLVWSRLPTIRFLPSRLHVRRQPGHAAGRLGWTQVRSTRRRVVWLGHRLGLCTSCAHASASSPGGWSGLSHRMSRIRSTLDSVSKAVSGTHSDLLSRIARLKPAAVTAGKGEAGPAPGAMAEEAPPREAPTPVVAEEGPRPGETAAREDVRPPAPPAQQGAGAVATVTKQTSDLFHPSYFAVNLGETYSYLAHHVNAYFGMAAKTDDKRPEDRGDVAQPPAPDGGKPDDARFLVPSLVSDKAAPESAPPPDPGSALPAPPTSPKKGIGHYLPNPGPSMQAFVGSYIAPLVPKFRSDPKGVAPEKDKPAAAAEEAPAKQTESAESKEQRAAEDRAKRLLQQREKIIARVSVDNRTRALVQALHRASDVKLYIKRVEDLSYHLLEFPETRGVAVKEKVIPCLLRLRQAGDPALQAAVREALALVGYTDPVKGRGIRVLSIDGGGTRGLVALQTLRELEDLTGKPIYQLFDYICGVSTGAILAFMLGVFQIPLNECEELYRKLGSDVFKQNVIVGTVKMGWSHAFYDSEAWENLLKERLGADLMVETARNARCPKVAAVSTIVNRGTPLKAYVFRNYNLQPGVRSHYLGGCQHKLWQAIRASSAAPGYFQEFVLGNDLHQDGGLLINNPTALAVHECKCLWPNTPLQCVVSLGTGRFESHGKNSTAYTSLKTKLTNVISSATDTEEVHSMLDALLPPDSYFRFNPFLSEDIALDESRRERLNLLQAQGAQYLQRNEEKLRRAAAALLQEKSALQRLAEWLRLKAHMYDGLPFSKL
ncbi:calcium-independent phospholipase A2-gamma [Anguilla anguilla]|uniref:calcium-independent phospholipase A2-gamma n=1 Tax=Anguilla anguilla TaxID=7936 RepID=UPI0015AA1B4F|nr:calcium-independent phospholipase A2-gamma [Anguilla anguilla]XP_035258183.1 calcium-independent phospholipase A2-gamma [Anguilla anguilla]